MSFHEVLFPSCCEVFLVGRSLFSTSKIICASGREIRNLDHSYHRGQYFLKDCFLSQNEFWVLNNFFKARRGSRFAFLLKDNADFSVQKQALDISDGIKKDFQLCKTYHDEKYPYIRKITKIKRDSLKLYTGEDEIRQYQLNQNNGVVTLSDPLVKDRTLYASFEFYLVVRFVEDSFDYQLKSDGTIEILNLSLIEVLE
jgi:uncharacterized protein (TIGR02217 family)